MEIGIPGTNHDTIVTVEQQKPVEPIRPRLKDEETPSNAEP